MDERLRRLERKAKTGCPDAQAELDAAHRQIQGFEPPVNEEITVPMVRDLFPLHCCLKKFGNRRAGDASIRNVARMLSTQTAPVTVDQLVKLFHETLSDSAVRRCLKKLHAACLVDVYRESRTHTYELSDSTPETWGLSQEEANEEVFAAIKDELRRTAMWRSSTTKMFFMSRGAYSYTGSGARTASAIRKLKRKRKKEGEPCQTQAT